MTFQGYMCCAEDAYWIGLTKHDNLDYRWDIDVQVEYANWAGNASRNESCVTLDRGGQWHDDVCDVDHRYGICSSLLALQVRQARRKPLL